MRSNAESGQATIAAIMLLPLILFVVFGVLLIGYALSVEAKASFACRTRVAQSQAEAAKAAHKLMGFNKQAMGLEAKRKTAKRAVLIANTLPHPAPKIAAMAALKAVEAAQVPVMQQQRYWLAMGRRASYNTAYQARQAVEQELPESFRKLALRGQLQSFVPKFKMIARPIGARTPTYTPAPDFTARQNGGIRWKTAERQAQTQDAGIGKSRNASDDDSVGWLARLQTLIPGLEIGCSMTLVPTKNGSLSLQPTEDKLSSNSSSL